MAVTPPAVLAVRSAFRVWRAIFDGRCIELRESRVFVRGRRAPICSTDDWQLIGGYFTGPTGWLRPAMIREHLTDLITNEDKGARVDEICALVDLGLELSEPALRVWHREGFAALTDKVRRKQLTSKVTTQREKIVRRIARTFAARPPAQRRGAYQYPHWSPQHKYRVQQLQILVEKAHKPGLLLDSLVRQAGSMRHRRADWRNHLPSNPWINRDLRSVVDEGAQIAVHDRLAFYLHVLYGPSINDGRTYTLTRFDPQAAAKPEHEQMLRVGGRMLAKWFDACPKRVADGPDFEHQVLDAVLAMQRRRLQGAAATDRIRDHWRKAQVLVDLAVADVVGTALNGRPDGAVSRWLTAGCLDAIVARVQAQATHERAPDNVSVLLERRDLDIELDARITKDIGIIVDQDFFDEYGALPHTDKKEN